MFTSIYWHFNKSKRICMQTNSLYVVQNNNIKSTQMSLLTSVSDFFFFNDKIVITVQYLLTEKRDSICQLR